MIYDKKNRSIITVYIDKAPNYKGSGWPNAPRPEVDNDLNEMPFVWPMAVTPEGNPYVYSLGKYLPVENRPEIFKNIEGNDHVIIVYH